MLATPMTIFYKPHKSRHRERRFCSFLVKVFPTANVVEQDFRLAPEDLDTVVSTIGVSAMLQKDTRLTDKKRRAYTG